jgi:hypothetical protein
MVESQEEQEWRGGREGPERRIKIIELTLTNARYSTLLYLPTLRFHVSEDAGIEPRTVATTTLAVRRSEFLHSFLLRPGYKKQTDMEWV